MWPEDIKRFVVEDLKRPSWQNARGVLHQRRNLPYSPTAMAAAGLLIVGAVGYFTLYAKAKPGTKPSDVAKVAAGVSNGEGSRQSNK